jgi:hypothetical protein
MFSLMLTWSLVLIFGTSILSKQGISPVLASIARRFRIRRLSWLLGDHYGCYIVFFMMVEAKTPYITNQELSSSIVLVI